MIDLRSDTVTVPTDEMRRVIAGADVGDDVYHDDPTVNELERTVAELLGKEDAVYTPTGTMANQIALRVHTRPGDRILVPAHAHVDTHEIGAANAVAGVTCSWLPVNRGTYTPRDVEAAIPDIPEEMPGWLYQPTTLLTAENTHNHAGGAAWPVELSHRVAQRGKELGLATHLDGARLWNAAIAVGASEAQLAVGWDTVSVCFSKGLGAPMGSALVGSAEAIATARRFKQMYGGGFRQAGMMAAGALHAVRHHRERLAEDHANAERLAAGLADVPGIDLDLETVQTNMVYFNTGAVPAHTITARCRRDGVLMLALDTYEIRAVTHLGVTAADIDKAIAAVRAAVARG